MCCPVGAIQRQANDCVVIDEDACVECEVCRTSGFCTAGALTMPVLAWPRLLRRRFSNPLLLHPETGVPGRGTEEMKTNEVTGRLRRDRAAITIELGRPGVGTRFSDVQKVTTALASLGVHFEPANPVTILMPTVSTGLLRPEVLDERVLSALVEIEIAAKDVGNVLMKLSEVSTRIETVFSVGLATRFEKEGRNFAAEAAEAVGFSLSPNGKINVGLGRPLREGA
jgi:hypothetical protein